MGTAQRSQLTLVNYVLIASLAVGKRAHAMRSLLLSALLLCSASGARAASTIDFEGYPDPTLTPSFVDSGATFTGIGDTTLFKISAFSGEGFVYGTNGPHILCPVTATSNCGGDFGVTFVSPVDALKFFFTGDNSAAPLSIEAFLGGVSLGSLSLVGDGNTSTSQLVDLSSFGALDSIKVTGAAADTNGFGYDDFSFTYLPEPSTWAMMLIGFGAIGLSARRRTKDPAISQA